MDRRRSPASSKKVDESCRSKRLDGARRGGRRRCRRPRPSAFGGCGGCISIPGGGCCCCGPPAAVDVGRGGLLPSDEEAAAGAVVAAGGCAAGPSSVSMSV